jgi:NADH-quinone oxidoreductase subunit G/NADP-reducing hydrogenase subunit HndD
MFGALSKTYYPQKAGIDPKDIVSVSVMPCTAKKYEAQRKEMKRDGIPDVDIVLTTRELAKMIKQAGIQFTDLADDRADSMMGEGTGAAVIFANTGGVMEAALRTVADILTGEDLKDIDYTAVRGLEGIKEASVNVAGLDVKVAIANSTGAASKLLDKVRSGEATYHFIEVMGCPGGCINGGGQPIIMDKSKTEEVKALRTAGIYNMDKNNPKRKSHKNEEVQKLYAEYLEAPGSHKAHHLLHTHYTNRGIK